MALSVVSLLCGPGGMDLGFMQAGFKIVWGIDDDKDSCETHKSWSDAIILNSDIVVIDRNKIPSSDVIISSILATPYSVTQKRNESVNNINSAILDIIKIVNSKAFVLEGTPALETFSKGKVLENLLQECESRGYNTYYKVLNTKNFGIAQDKKRLVIVGIRKDLGKVFKFPEPTSKKMTLGNILKDNINQNISDRIKISKKHIESMHYRTLDLGEISPTILSMKLPINPAIPAVDDNVYTISLQEAAQIQSFPQDFYFAGNKISKFKQIANAFPPKLAYEIANELKLVFDQVEINNNSARIDTVFSITNASAKIRNFDIKGKEKGGVKMEKLLLPDRYEGLENNRHKYDITKIILRVDEGLTKISELYEEMESSNRGAFLIFKGKSGCGKTTFLRTLDIFIDDLEIETITNNMNLVTTINSLKGTNKQMRVIIIEGRESLLDSSSREVNDSIHAINRFLRSENGKKTLVVWPCNDDDIIEVLVGSAENIGGTSLLGLDETYFEFHGPDKEHYVDIAKQTIELLNNGKTLLDFGIADKIAVSLTEEVDTIGKYLKRISKEIRKNKIFAEGLTKKEQCKMWIIVLAANEPDKDVAALTKGEFLTADINRMLVSTNANIVEELKKYPDKIGILANYFDCRIIYMPIVTTLFIIRDFADDKLREIMRDNNLSDKVDGSGLERLKNSELARMINAHYKLQAKKGKTGPDSINAFKKLVEIAEDNDKLLNRTFGKALVESGLVESAQVEGNYGNGLKRKTDLVCKTNIGEIRLEFMWRSNTSQAAISNYVLTKLYNYGKAIGMLE